MKIDLKDQVTISPALPLRRVATYNGSALLLEIVGVPAKIGNATVVGMGVSIVNADGATVSAPCTLMDGEWRVAFAASCFASYGFIERGVRVSATVRDGETVRDIVFAVGDLDVLCSSPSATPGDPTRALQGKGDDIYVKTRLVGDVQHYAKQTISYDEDMGAWGAEWSGDYILADGEFVPADPGVSVVAPALLALLLAVPFLAPGITATKEYVDRKDAAVAVAATNYTDTAVAAIPAPDYSTNNVELTNTIAQVAPAPGNYAAVSNRAINAVQTTDTDWLDVVAKTGRITTDAMGASYFFNGTADYAYKLMSEDGNHLLLLIDGRWTGFDWAGIRYRPLAYLSEVSSAATAATNYTDEAVAGKLDAEGNEYTIRSGTPGLTVDSVHGSSERTYVFSKPGYEGDPNTVARLSDIPESITPAVVTNIVRDLSLGGIWDDELEVWWTPVMRNGSLTYQATTNVNLNAEN